MGEYSGLLDPTEGIFQGCLVRPVTISAGLGHVRAISVVQHLYPMWPERADTHGEGKRWEIEEAS